MSDGAETPAALPCPVPDGVGRPYDEVIDSKGIRVPFVPAIITPRIERPLRSGRYEGGEAAALRAILRAGDRVLELGAGLGVLSTVAAQAAGVECVTAIEANPDLIPIIRETHRLNGVTTVDLRGGVVTAEPGADLPFYIRSDFWASSMEPGSRPFVRKADVPRFPLPGLIADLRPTVIVCDIEGGELGLFDGADLSGVRAVVMELHPGVYGAEGQARVIAALARQGLHPAQGNADSTVRLFERRPATAAATSAHAGHGPRPWPLADPRTLIVTCMKDEGPFILEWLAWHRAIGVTDIVVFTNDCTDGSDRLLDRLDTMGLVTHLPNPAVATGATAFQPIALAFAEHMHATRAADFFISMDVDEFINIHPGQGRLTDLFAATGPFDVLSMSELNHGANRREHYERGWLKDQFPAHQLVKSGVRRSRRGVKSIVQLSPKVERLRNHRPDMRADLGPVTWLDGSGRPLHSLMADRGENGIDTRGTYGLVTLNHFPLRSLDSFLVKMFRGDVVINGRQVSQTYWRMRNRNDQVRVGFAPADADARRFHREVLESDAALMALHDACCAAHEARIADLLTRPEFIARRDWALREKW